MKQRLLMTLCLLLATWGMANAADITLKIPAVEGADGKAGVTVTISNSAAVLSTGTSPYYPEFTPSVVPTVTNSKTATYKIPYTTFEQTVTVKGIADKLKNVSITVDGKVTAFTCPVADALFNNVEKLTFTNNGELAAINLEGFAQSLSYLNVDGNKLNALTGLSKCTEITEVHAANNQLGEYHGLNKDQAALKKVDLSGNKIAYAKISQDVIDIIKANKGMLTLSTQEYELQSAASSIQNWYANRTNNSLSAAIQEFFGVDAEAKDFDFTWKKEDKTIPLRSSNATNIPTGDTEAIVQDAVWPDKFIFRNNSKYFYGTYSVEITGKTGTDFAGITYKIPAIEVTAAQFTFAEGTLKDVKAYLDVTLKQPVVENSTIVKQGQTLTVYAEDKEGYQLDYFDISGLTLKESTLVEAWAVFVVDGSFIAKDDKPTPLSLKAVYKPATYKLTVRAAKGGELQISYKDEQGNPVTVRNGSEIPYGAWLDITVLTEDGYEFSQLRDGYDLTGETALKPEADNANYFKLEVKKDVDLVPVFNKITKATLTLQYPEGSNRQVLVMVNDQPATYANANKQTLKVNLDDVVTIYPKDKEGKELTEEIASYIVAGTKRIPVVNGSATFTVTGSMDVTIVFTPLQEIAIIPEVGTIDAGGVYNYAVTYTGKPYAYPYRTNPNTPAGNDNVEVYCRLSSTSPEAPNIGNPTNVGVYAFEFTRPADSKFQKAEKVTARLEIKAATPVISELPTVTVENGVFKLKGGKAVFNGTECKGTFAVTTATVPSASAMVDIKFTASDTHNFHVATAQVPVIIDGKAIDTYDVIIAKQLPTGVEEIEIRNGAYIVADGSKVKKGTKLSFKTVLADGYYYVRNNPDTDGTFFLANADGSKINGTELSNASETVYKNLRVNVTAPKRDNPQTTIVVNTSILSQETAYTTAAQRLKIDDLSDLIQKSNEMTGIQLSDFIIKYFDKDNKEIDLPVNAGTYKVALYRPADETYKAVNETGRLVINPLTATIKTIPTASLIAQGQSLKDATLNGGEVKAILFEGTADAREINVAGTFDWKESVSNPTNGQTYRVTFYPEDNVNFLYDATDAQVSAKVSNKKVVTWGNPQNGTVVVKVSDRVLESGDEVVEGEKLVITAVPNDGFEFVSLYVNGSSCSNGATYTVGDESVSIAATFKVQEVYVPIPVPTDPTAVKVILRVNAPNGGYILDMPTENVVSFGGNFSFSVKTAEADKYKLSVIGGTDTQLASINGRFSLTEIKQDTVITITLTDPTKLKVTVEKESKNTGGYRLGTVEISQESKDSTYYYGTELILVAYPESGVSFVNWSDNTRLTSKYRTYVVTGDTEIKPVFRGTPTGIDSIETAQVYGSRGCIVLRGVGEAKVTIVSMDGRIQKQLVSGDTQIDALAGVYGVILEHGDEVKRLKVIVK